MMDFYYVKLLKAALNPTVVLHRLALPTDHLKPLLVDGVSYKCGSSVKDVERFQIKDERSETPEGDLMAVANKTKEKECRSAQLNRRESEESDKEEASLDSENSGDSEAENRPNSCDEMETDSESHGSDGDDHGEERLGSKTRAVVSEESPHTRKTIRL